MRISTTAPVRLGTATVLTSLLIFTLPGATNAQNKAAAGKHKKHVGSPNELAVDVVFHKNGKRFHGALTKNDDQQVEIAVDRTWLATKYPKYYGDHLTMEQAEVDRYQKKQLDRIDEWKKERKDSPELKFFLESERENIVLRATELANLRFTMLKFRQSDVRRIVQQPNDQRKVALVAWKQDLADVPERSAKSLYKELVANKVDFDTVNLDFTDDVPPSGQSDRSWSVRKAMVEYDLLERIDYHGLDGMFMEEGADPNAAGILRVLMGSGGSQLQQIGEMLDIPEFTRNRETTKPKSKVWWKETAAKVDKKGLRCFSITRMDNNMMADEVNIEVALIAKDNKGPMGYGREFCWICAQQ